MQLPETEGRVFKCPRCHKPILSRKGDCIFCLNKFDDKTFFSCPRCGALISQADKKCPGCDAPLSDSGIGPGTMTEKEADELITELEKLSREMVEKIDLGTAELSPEERERIDILAKRMLEVQVLGAEELGIRDIFPKAKIEEEDKKPPEAAKREARGGRINGLAEPKKEAKPGMVNGLKKPRVRGPRARPSWMQKIIIGRFPVWQILSIVIVIVIILSSLLVVVNLGPSEKISIDGDFSDWSSVSAYSFSVLPHEHSINLIEAKVTASENYLFIYLEPDNLLFAGTEPSVIYAFMDVDGDSETGYELSEDVGAELVGILIGWNNSVRSSLRSEYVDDVDQSNWSAWSAQGGLQWAQSDEEIEIALNIDPDVDPEVSIIKMISVVDGLERRGPSMSVEGTVIAIQKPLLQDQVVMNLSQPVLNISAIAMGTDFEDVSVQAELVDKSGERISVGEIEVSTSIWTEMNLSADLSSLQMGDAFIYSLSIGSDVFKGTMNVLGETARGYYLSSPAQIQIDGLFGDWIGRKSADQDPEPLENPNIDIDESGAATEGGHHNFFVGVAGTALGGTDVPEQRLKTVSPGPPSPVIRLRKTGEDLLQTFIDRDPGNTTGRLIQAGTDIIYADLLVEIYGRNSVATSSSVMEWSAVSSEWVELGDIGDVAAESEGVEFSVDKYLFGNLSGSEIIFFTTDWKARSDYSLPGSVLADPWAILGGGDDYRSGDGINWAFGDSISLETGDQVVDIVTSPSRDYVFAITNTGRSYRWWVGQSSSWSSILTNPIPATTDVVAISMCSSTAGFAFTASGNIYNKSGMSPINPDKNWNFVSQIPGGFSDYADLAWRAGNLLSTAQLYAMRSTLNTYLNRTDDGGTTWSSIGNPTGSSDEQQQMAVISGASDELFVMDQDGGLRYSSDSGTSWSSIGDLPPPDMGNTSVYCGLAIDAQSNIWVITDTGYCFKSIDGGNSFIYTGRPVNSDIVGLTAPIPEFSTLMIPILSLVAFVLIFQMNLKRKRE